MYAKWYCFHGHTTLTRTPTRCTVCPTLAEKPDGESGAFEMKYGL